MMLAMAIRLESTQQYAALVRFGLWDEMIAQLAPDRAPAV